MFLAPVDIHGCISFNITAITKIATDDSHLWSRVCCYQFLALCYPISNLFRVIIFVSLVNFTVCVICRNLDSQITPTTEDLQAPTHWDGLPSGTEDKAIVNRGFGSYNTKQVKSPINHLPLCPKRAVSLHHCFQELKLLISVSFFINESVWSLAVCILINNTCINIKKSKVLFETRMNDTVFSRLHFYQKVCIWLESAHTNWGCKDASHSITIKRTWWTWWSTCCHTL